MSAAHSWAPINLLDEHRSQAPELLMRSDDMPLLYRGRLHALYAEPEAGKTWAALAACHERIAAGEPVVFVDYEDGFDGIEERLGSLGTDCLNGFEGLMHYYQPDRPLDDDSQADLLRIEPALVVIDSVTEALVMEGLGRDDLAIARLYGRLARPFARAGAAVLLIDHVVKNPEHRGRYAIGAQAKLSGVDVGYRLDVVQPFGRGQSGLVRAIITKDRPGHLRLHAGDRDVIAAMRVEPNDSALAIRFEPPDVAAVPDEIVDRVRRAIEDQPGIGARAIRAAVEGKSNHIDGALQLLVDAGHVRVEPHGRARRHHPM